MEFQENKGSRNQDSTVRKAISRDVDNSREPGKIPGCQLDFPGLISPRGMVPSSGPTAQITAYQVQSTGSQNFKLHPCSNFGNPGIHCADITV